MTSGVQPGAEAFGRETGDKRRGCLPLGTIRATGTDSRRSERRATERRYSPASVTVARGGEAEAEFGGCFQTQTEGGDPITDGSTPTHTEATMDPLTGHPLFKAWANELLHRAARQGHAEATKILHDPDMLAFYHAGLPTVGEIDPTPAPVPPAPIPPDPTPAPHPIRDMIAALFAKIIANPQAFIAFLMQIISLFGG